MFDAALAIGMVALALAALSLGWQVYTWQRSTGRVKVELIPQGVSTGGSEHRETWSGRVVSVRNVGRSAVFVEDVKMHMDNQPGAVSWQLIEGPQTIYELPAGAMCEWEFRLRELDIPAPVVVRERALVFLGNGKIVSSNTLENELEPVPPSWGKPASSS